MSETLAAFSRDLAAQLRSLPKTAPVTAYGEPL
jgi:hypothetical protein